MSNDKHEDVKPETTPPLPASTCSVVELANRIPFKMVMHMNCGNKHHLDYLNEELNLACCITTPYRRAKPGKGVKEFGINERGAKGYRKLHRLLQANPKIALKAALLYPPNTELSHGREHDKP